MTAFVSHLNACGLETSSSHIVGKSTFHFVSCIYQRLHNFMWDRNVELVSEAFPTVPFLNTTLSGHLLFFVHSIEQIVVVVFLILTGETWGVSGWQTKMRMAGA